MRSLGHGVGTLRAPGHLLRARSIHEALPWLWAVENSREWSHAKEHGKVLSIRSNWTLPGTGQVSGTRDVGSPGVPFGQPLAFQSHSLEGKWSPGWERARSVKEDISALWRALIQRDPVNG